MRAVITGTGMAVPDTVVTNDDLSRIMDRSIRACIGLSWTVAVSIDKRSG